MRRIDSQRLTLTPGDPLLNRDHVVAHVHPLEQAALGDSPGELPGEENSSWEAAWIDLGGEG
jgi:hypothetical protein